MSGIVIVGAQWGDEGKGKIVDLIAPYAELVVRYAGGANAGHTLVVGGEQLILHLVPSGILHEDKHCLIGQGTVIDPHVLLEEIRLVQEKGVTLTNRFTVSERAHLVLPQHKAIDALREARQGAIGTTKRGIGPAYEDKAGRRGLRIGDLLRPETFRAKLQANLEAWQPVFEALGGTPLDPEAIIKDYLATGEQLASFIGEVGSVVGDALAKDARVLFEGAQGTMLDIDSGTYPFVTSSNAVAGGATTGSGVGPTAISGVIGIAKAYTTRVGGGPFPTELQDATGNKLRDAGAEFGATTGRPRRCGWLDIVPLRLAVRANGLTELAITKLDVLTGFAELQICVAYELDGKRYEVPPYGDFDRVTPIYESVEGWTEDIRNCRHRADLPDAARHYLDRIEALTKCPVGIVSVGPDREETAELVDPFIGRGA